MMDMNDKNRKEEHKPRVVEIRLDQVPSIQDIKSIETREDFVKWAEKFIKEVTENTERFPHANLEVTMFLGALKNWAEKQVEALCENTGAMDASELDWKSVAFVLRGVLQSRSDI